MPAGAIPGCERSSCSFSVDAHRMLARASLPVVNMGIALSVVFDMVTKPASVPVALGVIAIGIVASAALSLRRPVAAVEQARAT